jgi:hypothetical protein
MAELELVYSAAPVWPGTGTGILEASPVFPSLPWHLLGWSAVPLVLESAKFRCQTMAAGNLNPDGSKTSGRIFRCGQIAKRTRPTVRRLTGGQSCARKRFGNGGRHVMDFSYVAAFQPRLSAGGTRAAAAKDLQAIEECLSESTPACKTVLSAWKRESASPLRRVSYQRALGRPEASRMRPCQVRYSESLRTACYFPEPWRCWHSSRFFPEHRMLAE